MGLQMDLVVIQTTGQCAGTAATQSRSVTIKKSHASISNRDRIWTVFWIAVVSATALGTANQGHQNSQHRHAAGKNSEHSHNRDRTFQE